MAAGKGILKLAGGAMGSGKVPGGRDQGRHKKRKRKGSR